MTKLRNILVLLCLAVVGTSADEGAARLLLSKQVNSKSYFHKKKFDVLITMSHLDSQQVGAKLMDKPVCLSLTHSVRL